jgi:hypothetical protein
MDDLDAIKWPEHKTSLHVTHNQHLGYYETIEQAIATTTYDRRDFPDEAEIARCIETGEVWEIQWYPRTPVSFNRVCAATLSRALQYALEVANG